jgi:hypothetical protein
MTTNHHNINRHNHPVTIINRHNHQPSTIAIVAFNATAKNTIQCSTIWHSSPQPHHANGERQKLGLPQVPWHPEFLQPDHVEFLRAWRRQRWKIELRHAAIMHTQRRIG